MINVWQKIILFLHLKHKFNDFLFQNKILCIFSNSKLFVYALADIQIVTPCICINTLCVSNVIFNYWEFFCICLQTTYITITELLIWCGPTNYLIMSLLLLYELYFFCAVISAAFLLRFIHNRKGNCEFNKMCYSVG